MVCTNNPRWLGTAVAVGLAILVSAGSAAGVATAEQVERWGIFEVTLKSASLDKGPGAGNPFVDVQLCGRFRRGRRVIEVEGFYDGAGIFRIRFMPDELGQWSYVTQSNRAELDGKRGKFVCVQPSPDNHGPVRVYKRWHFRHADGTPYFEVGTTCYAWVHQGDALEEQTLRTLSRSPFNKIRMCVFPKSFVYNQNEPQYYPFEGKPPRQWDFTRFNPAFWRHFEKRVGQLRDLGIEADIILFHPYDRWGFSQMTRQADDRYLRYVIARLAAYRNVWWSMANEYDLMKSKSMADWDRFFQIVTKHDPYGHLRGIHNCRTFYDHSKAWVTHVSIQSSDLVRGLEWRQRYNKPVVFDECRYEGDIPQGWGNITAEEMTHRFWLGAIRGCYVGHGETYKHPRDILWWSKGGVLRGQSPARIAFFKKIMEACPFSDMVPADLGDGNYILSKAGKLYLVYSTQGKQIDFELAGERPYKLDAIETWKMEVVPLGSAEPGRFVFAPPRARYLLRLTVYEPGQKLRPRADVDAEPRQGFAPLTVRFSTPSKLHCRWDFGDGSGAVGQEVQHRYEKPGLYTAKLTVQDEQGISTCAFVQVVVDRPADEPIVRVGWPRGESKDLQLHGPIRRTEQGAYDFGTTTPWKWISVGDEAIEELEALQSFTILGWAKLMSLETGSGGNRIAFNLNYDHSGFDLVCLGDGQVRLSVNEWPDKVNNDSSPGKLKLGQWTFFAVTYDASKDNNVCWYFGDQQRPAQLDRINTYNRGPTSRGSGPLTIGNYNRTIHRHGKDRQFRGLLRGIEIYGCRIGPQGALSLEMIRQRQRAAMGTR